MTATELLDYLRRGEAILAEHLPLGTYKWHRDDVTSYRTSARGNVTFKPGDVFEVVAADISYLDSKLPDFCALRYHVVTKGGVELSVPERHLVKWAEVIEAKGQVDLRALLVRTSYHEAQPSERSQRGVIRDRIGDRIDEVLAILRAAAANPSSPVQAKALDLLSYVEGRPV